MIIFIYGQLHNFEYFRKQVLTVLVLPTVAFLLQIIKVRTTEDIARISQSLNQEIISEIESKAKLLAPLSSSATKVARILSTSVNETMLSFPVIEAKVHLAYNKKLWLHRQLYKWINVATNHVKLL